MEVQLKRRPRGEWGYLFRFESPQQATEEGEAEEAQRVVHGLKILLTTPDPATLPLPNPGLLLLHSVISNIAWARAGAEEFDDSPDGDSSNGALTPIWLGSPISSIGLGSDRGIPLSGEHCPPEWLPPTNHVLDGKELERRLLEVGLGNFRCMCSTIPIPEASSCCHCTGPRSSRILEFYWQDANF